MSLNSICTINDNYSQICVPKVQVPVCMPYCVYNHVHHSMCYHFTKIKKCPDCGTTGTYIHSHSFLCSSWNTPSGLKYLRLKYQLIKK